MVVLILRLIYGGFVGVLVFLFFGIFVIHLYSKFRKKFNELYHILLKVTDAQDEFNKKQKAADLSLSVLLNQNQNAKNLNDVELKIRKKVAEIFNLTSDEELKTFLENKATIMLQRFKFLYKSGIRNTPFPEIKQMVESSRISINTEAKTLGEDFHDIITPINKADLDFYLMEIKFLMEYRNSNDVSVKFLNISYNYIIQSIEQSFLHYQLYKNDPIAFAALKNKTLNHQYKNLVEDREYGNVLSRLEAYISNNGDYVSYSNAIIILKQQLNGLMINGELTAEESSVRSYSVRILNLIDSMFPIE
jgi:hypothetical protein